MIYKRHPATVRMNEVNLCALRQVFAAKQEIFLKRFRDESDRDSARKFGESLKYAVEEIFLPDKSSRALYLTLAEVGLEALHKTEMEFDCGHSKEAHILALKYILAVLEPTYFPN